ncbi:fluoride efflux transporter CrcB [Bacillus sp. FJAT-47783]|uniref:fluoride efflux transporter CrcB n=1 Tax=Bacillus sp. FJAT-47783 TaxID=2922712 RepID=UPI001FADBAE5|nr:fluoride efflux transporter CrcB [Bacillus sp. FJAT-47783]
MIYVWIGIGAFFGAISRYYISNWVQKNVQPSFPYATFFVNVLGSFLLGLFVGLSIEGEAALLLSTGFLGSFTTFSTFKLEVVKLWRQQEKKKLLVYLLSSYMLGIGFAFFGIWIGRFIIN